MNKLAAIVCALACLFAVVGCTPQNDTRQNVEYKFEVGDAVQTTMPGNVIQGSIGARYWFMKGDYYRVVYVNRYGESCRAEFRDWQLELIPKKAEEE